MTSALRTSSTNRGMTMRKLALIVCALGVIFVGTGTALAQKGGKEKAPKVKSYDFSGDTIEGDLQRPDNTLVDAGGVMQFSSLIRIRKDFIAEIIKAAEDL